MCFFFYIIIHINSSFLLYTIVIIDINQIIEKYKNYFYQQYDMYNHIEYYGPFCSSKPELEQHHSG